MKFKTIDDFQWKGKKVLLRSDLNSEVVRGKLILSDRIIESAKTISELKKKGAKVVVLAHQGSPDSDDFISLKQHAKLLNGFVKIKFVKDILGKKAVGEIIGLKNGEALLLENVRMLKEEFFPSLKSDMVRILSPLFDIYINDAFSVCHRNHTSIVSFPRVLPSGTGKLMERELNALENLNVKDALFVLGGMKNEGNLKVARKAKKILASGLFGALVVMSRGINLGRENEVLKDDLKFVSELKRIDKKIVAPVDFAVDFRGKRQELLLDEFPSHSKVFDIGHKSVKIFTREIMKAKSVFMSGPAGICDREKFCYGTRELFNAIIKSGKFSVIGGGHTITALKEMGINKKKFGYVSLSGGALESFVAGEKLVGLEVLKK